MNVQYVYQIMEMKTELFNFRVMAILDIYFMMIVLKYG